MLYEPADICPDEANGSGTVDLTQGLTVRWQPAGDTALTAFRLCFYAPDAAGTLLYDTGRRTLPLPFYGLDCLGRAQRFAFQLAAETLAEAGLQNGGEYRLVITQWSGSESVTQGAASVFRGRTAPRLVLADLPDPLTARSYRFSAEHTQAEGDGLRRVRWQLALAGAESEPFYDSGDLLTPLLRLDWDGFLPGFRYAVRLRTVSSAGAEADTGWQTFACAYPTDPTPGALTAQNDPEGGVRLRWSPVEGAVSCTLLRQAEGAVTLQPLGSVDAEVTQLLDLTACPGRAYRWYLFPESKSTALRPLVSESVTVRGRLTLLLECEPAEEENSIYSLCAVHRFLPAEAGALGNGSSPSLQPGFGRYPPLQKDETCALQGTLSAVIGFAAPEALPAGLSLPAALSGGRAEAEALTLLSRSEKTLFLLDPALGLRQIALAGPVSLTVDRRSAALPLRVSIPWVESGSTERVGVIDPL